ncbi:PH domain-containing protein [Anaerovorax odorimutans]|uniref:PH domain-containing protein n=1 Tax=Anaerovorax odorimutans TaxID=109327 RepID=UPI00040E2C41|nr:PH domain-containing protein [Anaerovorax odorimutans]
MNSLERNHWCIIFSLFFKKTMTWIILIILIYKNFYAELGFGKTSLIVLAFVFFIFLFSVLNWYKQTFYFKEESIYFKSGIVNIKTREVPFNKVNTVDLSQGIIDILLGLSKIKIDTASVGKGENELFLLLKKDRAIEIKNTILNRENDSTILEKEIYDSYSLSYKELLIYALTSNVILNGMGIIFVIYSFLDDYIFQIFNIKLFEEDDITMQYFLEKGIWIICFIIFLSVCLSIINSFVKYYNFKVYTEKDKLNITYGLFNKKHYSFDKNKIKGIYSKQNLMKQFFNIKTIEVESIGYGDEKGEKAILYPICNRNLELDILNRLLPELVFSGDEHKSPKRALVRFIWKKIIFVLIIAGILIYYSKYGFISILLFPFVIFLGYMQHKNTAVGMEKNLVYISCNGFNKVQSVVKMNTVQSFTMSYTYFQKRRSLCNYEISIFSNELFKSIKAKNLNSNLIKEYLIEAK